MKLVSPYRNIKQYTRISIEPHQMNSDIRNNMKINLKKKIEKKCNKNGYVDEVYRIVEYSDGKMPPENLNGSAKYDITYHCRICVPVENTVIIAQVKVINQELIIAINGPIMIFIPKENVDSNAWDIPDNYLNKASKKRLKVDDYVKIQIIDKRINQNDSQIKSIGRLLDFTNNEEIDKYFGAKIITDNTTEDVKIINEPVSEPVSETNDESNFIM